MPRHQGSQQGSAPPSPICSDTLSLPDASSDLDNLSDYSGLSVSDDDDKHSRSNTESDAELLSDGDLEEITYSMLGSMDFRSHGTPSRSERATSTASQGTDDADRTPSSSTGNKQPRPLALLSQRISARDLTYPKLYQPDAEPLFGLNLTSLYNKLEEERAIARDQDLQDYSILDVQGESFRPKYERAVQTDSETNTIVNSAATLRTSPQSSTFGPQWSDDERLVASVSRLPSIQRDPAPAGDGDSGEDKLVARDDEEDYPSFIANSQRYGHRWLNKQTFGVIGVVLLSIAAYHVKTAPWLSADTGALFVNTTTPEPLSHSSATSIAHTTDRPLHKAAPLIAAQPGNNRPATGPASTASEQSKDDSEFTPTQSASSLLHTTEKAALASLPSSISALISMASSGMASLSTHVASASSYAPRSKDSLFQDITASRENGHRCSERISDASASRKSASAVLPSVGLMPYGTTALSTLPRRAQKGLSILTHRSTLSAPGYADQRGARQKHAKKHQVSRRTGKHWINAVSRRHERRGPPGGLDNTSLDKASRQENTVHTVRAPFSRLSAQNFWSIVAPSRYDLPIKLKSTDPAGPEDSKIDQMLFLNDALPLSSLSFGSLCKQVDDLLLPYAQNILDTLHSFEYGAIWSWLHGTMRECYQIMSPFVATIDAYSKKHAREWRQGAETVASNSLVQMDNVYAEAQAYLYRLDVALKPVVQRYSAVARETVQDITATARRTSQQSIKQVYRHSKSAIDKASWNARKLVGKRAFVRREIGQKKYLQKVSIPSLIKYCARLERAWSLNVNSRVWNRRANSATSRSYASRKEQTISHFREHLHVWVV